MIKLRLSLLLIFGAFLFSPFFVVAKTCYVDDGVGGGDGSKDKPYNTITKALNKGCDNVKVKKGKYKEKIELGKGVEVEGSGSDTIINGKVRMGNKSSLEDIYVASGGIEILKNANASLKNVKVENAHIGITTVGSGKLTVKNCKIQHNGKGFYLRYGKDVDLQNNTIINNGEEGVDIRANVDGIISGNVIESNKEGGIEVILGKSELQITNNSIKHNKASGIALQFYKENPEIGDITIKNNKLVGNGNYGIDCKIPSGGHTQSQYWSKSVDFGYNFIKGNGKGILSESCKFKDDKIDRATLTIKEIEEKKKKQEAEKQKQKEIEKVKNTKKQKEEETKKKEAMVREALWQKDKILKKYNEEAGRCSMSENDLKTLKKRSSLKIFFIGPDKEMIKKYKNRENKCAEVIKQLEREIKKIPVEDIKKEMENNYLHKLEQQIGIITAERERYQNRFGLWPWIKKLFGK